MTFPNTLAGNGTQGSFSPFQLFAGEKEVVTSQADVVANTAFAQFEVFALDATGKIAKFDPAGAAPLNKVAGVTAQAIASAAAPTKAAYYRSGYFNHEALVWPAATDTLAERKVAVAGSEIEVGALYGAA